MSPSLKESLLKLYVEDAPERVGFVLPDGSLIEVPNVSGDPYNSFDVSAESLLQHAGYGSAIGAWHTHPNASSNLSVDDYEGFLNWPKMTHYIVGNDGVSAYIIKEGLVHVAP
jgi:proteasome lid subunit RPN8/RPN11